jgi:anti-sigma factor RsiW
MHADERKRFAAHLAVCPVCDREIEADAMMDQRVARALLAESPQTARIEQAVRKRIAAEGTRRRWLALGAIAAGALIAIAGAYWWLRPAAPAPGWYADAARDHRVEVIEGQPRRWRTDALEIEQVAAQSGLSPGQAAGLAAAGYRLERAKICGLAGERMLHLVFSDGARRYSVYVGRHQSTQDPVRVEQRGSEEVAGFETGQYRAAVVSQGAAAECRELARAAAARL